MPPGNPTSIRLSDAELELWDAVVAWKSLQLGVSLGRTGWLRRTLAATKIPTPGDEHGLSAPAKRLREAHKALYGGND